MGDIRKAYLKLVRRYPPEQFPERFNEVKIAYDKLTMAGNVHETLLGELINSEDVTKLKRAIFGDMIDETETGSPLASLMELADSARLVNPEEFLSGFDPGPVEYADGPLPEKSRD
jgi:hypothetical protein